MLCKYISKTYLYFILDIVMKFIACYKYKYFYFFFVVKFISIYILVVILLCRLKTSQINNDTPFKSKLV